jgi:hypothetical protein
MDDVLIVVDGRRRNWSCAQPNPSAKSAINLTLNSLSHRASCGTQWGRGFDRFLVFVFDLNLAFHLGPLGVSGPRIGRRHVGRYRNLGATFYLESGRLSLLAGLSAPAARAFLAFRKCLSALFSWTQELFNCPRGRQSERGRAITAASTGTAFAFR